VGDERATTEPARRKHPHLPLMLGPAVLCLLANHVFFVVGGEARLELLGAGIFLLVSAAVYRVDPDVLETIEGRNDASYGRQVATSLGFLAVVCGLIGLVGRCVYGLF
jgi:hypothetical protein